MVKLVGEGKIRFQHLRNRLTILMKLDIHNYPPKSTFRKKFLRSDDVGYYYLNIFIVFYYYYYYYYFVFLPSVRIIPRDFKN